jgi:flagellar biosynthesis protein FliQ
MTTEFYDLISQSWRVLLLIVVPAFAIPLAGGGFSLLLGFFGVRDEGLVYAARVLAMVGVGALFLPSCAEAMVALMAMALR